MCMTSVLAKKMRAHSADLQFKNVFGRRICRLLLISKMPRNRRKNPFCPFHEITGLKFLRVQILREFRELRNLFSDVRSPES